MERTLADWLDWQESLNPAEIELGLERISRVGRRLNLRPPSGRVFVVAGTNGKGSTVATIDALLRANDFSTGVYTSPHLLRYNERICLSGNQVSDAQLVAAFERVEAARQGEDLTYFEFGTLAAFSIFSAQKLDAWVLEVGLGGRLDAVNMVDADYPVITTIDFDHQAWLGETLDEIAAEKAGILRSRRTLCYGDVPVPGSIVRLAAEQAVTIRSPESGFSSLLSEAGWGWRGQEVMLANLPLPAGGPEQIRNQSLALAAIEVCDPGLLASADAVSSALSSFNLPGRLQRNSDGMHQWLLDVAHNPQAGRALAAAIARETAAPVTVVVGLMADKRAQDFVAELTPQVGSWITCPSGGARGAQAAALADVLEGMGSAALASGSVQEALALARQQTPTGGLIVVCGSFTVVGPALDALGLY